MKDLAAIILAGGRSSRMGHDKALISIGSETLIERTCHSALAVTETVLVVSPWPERYQPLLPKTVKCIQEKALSDTTPMHQGPAVALALALETPEASRSTWLLALACDLPNLPAQALTHWAALLPTYPTDVIAALPQRQGRWEPLCGFYRTRCRNSLKNHIQVGGRSFQSWLATQSVAQLPLADDFWLINLNTPDELTRWQLRRQ